VHLASANLPEYQTGAHRAHRNNLCVASFCNDVEQLVWLSFSWRGGMMRLTAQQKITNR